MRSFQPDTIIALGGGSPMDAAKAMWLFYEQPQVDFEDLVQKFMDIRKRAFRFPELGRKAKFIGIPTTSGTGSEVTPFTVISDGDKKYPIADYSLTPTISIVDPAFTMTVPAGVTADTGLDVLTHAVEAYVSVLRTTLQTASPCKPSSSCSNTSNVPTNTVRPILKRASICTMLPPSQAWRLPMRS